MREPRGIKKGEFNLAIGAVGVPGSGKSVYALRRAVELGKTTPAYVVAHDPGYNFPDKFPDGTPTGVRRYESTTEVLARLRVDASGVHAVQCPDADDVIQLATDISKASLARGGGERGLPTVLLLDEAVAVGDASPHRLGEGLRHLLTLRRHRHVGLIWTSQSPRLCHYMMLSLATEMAFFRLQDPRDVKHLEIAGIPPEVTERITQLENYKSIIYNFRDRTVVEGNRKITLGITSTSAPETKSD